MKQNLDCTSLEPLYIQLKNKIESEIDVGIYKQGDKIPSEIELCQKYGISRITVRKTLAVLSEEGTLERKQGKGTFISAKKDVNLSTQNKVKEYIKVIGKFSSSKIVSIKKVADKIEIIKMHYADSIPIALQADYYPMAYSYLLDIKIDESVYKTLSMFDVYPTNCERILSMVSSPQNISKMLNVSENATILLSNENVYDQKGRILHTSQKYINCRDIKIEL